MFLSPADNNNNNKNVISAADSKEEKMILLYSKRERKVLYNMRNGSGRSLAAVVEIRKQFHDLKGLFTPATKSVRYIWGVKRNIYY